MDEATAAGTRATLTIAGAEEYELSSFWIRDGEGRHPYYYADDPAVAAPLESRRLNENRDFDLGLLDVWATVTRYPSAADAERAARLWLDEQQGEPLQLADGTEGRWDADSTGAAAATTRGGVLVTVDIDDWSWEE
ncbi:hypothetical protein [Blastococcus atacamensis]|uniref:hypothetical protein n=1 Tax=Blastococcus atacamensis TaxID=2070508 RepID=UPI0012FFDA9A|nr:hypothetical protein [Blastococcus atacamensis]